MEKKENKDMVYYRVDENNVMRADVVDTFNNILRYYIDGCYESYTIGLLTQKQVRELIKNTKELYMKIFSKYKQDIEYLLSSEEIKKTFSKEIKTKQEVNKALASSFYLATFYAVTFEKGEQEISKQFQEVITEKQREINNIKQKNIQNQEEKHNETEVKVENKEQKNAIKKIDDSNPLNFHANKNIVNNFIIKKHTSKGKNKRNEKQNLYSRKPNSYSRKQNLYRKQNVTGTRQLNRNSKNNAKYY